MTRILVAEQVRATELAYGHVLGARRFWETITDVRTEEYSHLLRFFSNEVGKGGRVIDLGSGTGLDVSTLRGAGCTAFGVDKSIPLVRYATQRYGPFFFCSDLSRPQSIRGAIFDGLLAAFSLIHLPITSWPGALDTMVALLRRGGTAFITVKEGQGVICDRRLGPSYPRYVQLCEEGELAAFVRAAGFASCSIARSAASSPAWLHCMAVK